MRVCKSVLRVVHVLRARERLQRPVDEAVEEDKASAGGPDHEDGDEGGTQIIDHLQAGRRHPNRHIIMENQHPILWWQCYSFQANVGASSVRRNPYRVKEDKFLNILG